jgi:hypothetical protein
MSEVDSIKGLKSMLREIGELAEHASLTGGMASGAPRAIQRYNAILRQLVEQGAIGRGIFEELNPETTDFGQLAVDARLLASYLNGKAKSADSGDSSVLVRLAPFVRGEDLALLVKEHLSKGAPLDPGIITSLAPFLPQEMLGTIVREQMVHPGSPPTASAAPAAPQPTPRAEPTLAELAEKLSRPELSGEERREIAAKLAELAKGS